MIEKTIAIFPLAFLALLLAGSAQADESYGSLKAQLERQGWQVEQTREGDLVLRPPVQSPTETEEPKSHFQAASLDELARKLKAGGWRVERDAAGNLLLYPHRQEPPQVAIDETGLERLQQAGWTIERASDGSLLLFPPGHSKEASTTGKGDGDRNEKASPLARLKKRLEAAGWEARFDQEGSLVVVPKPRKTESKKPVPSHPLNQTMRKRLQAAGWTLREERDGSLLLFPPRLKAEMLTPCPGLKTTASVALPMENADTAREVAEAWLEATGLPNATVGKIRKVLRIYLVSIVSSKSPHHLLHQLAIRISDGHVILLN
jgi:hypothetical protein